MQSGVWFNLINRHLFKRARGYTGSLFARLLNYFVLAIFVLS